MISTTPKRCAIIDLGSNSARAVVMDYAPGFSFHLEDELREIVRLREGMTDEGLSEEAMQRGLFVLHLFKGFCDSLKVDHIVATATSAVREAANGKKFLERVEREVGLRLRILSGEEEAMYGVMGALGAVQLERGVVVDIGGGSAQVSRVENGHFTAGQALTLGALALTERFVKSDPIKKTEMRAVQNEIGRQLDELKWLPSARGPLVGLGGTIRNLAKIEATKRRFPLQSINGFELSRSALDETIAQLSTLPLVQRRKIPGLVRDRADIILPGALVIRAVLERVGASHLTVSENGLREGLFFKQFWRDVDARPSLREWSVLNLARFYNYQPEYSQQVQYLATRLFDELGLSHRYGKSERELLGAAALLHNIGVVVRYNDHHKYSQLLVTSNGLPGYSPREVALIGLLTRYHRKGEPMVGEYNTVLKSGDETRLLWLSAILRLATFLERGRSGAVKDIKAKFEDGKMHIALVTDEDALVELWSAQQSALELMTKACGCPVVLKRKKDK